MKKLSIVIAVAMLGGCATAQKINRPDGTTEYIVQCGAGTGWDVCYSKANEACPSGYVDVSKESGFNRKELRVKCQ